MAEESTSTTEATGKNEGEIMLLPSPRLNILSFAVSVPTTMDTITFEDDYYDDEEDAATSAAQNEFASDFLEVPKRPKPPAPAAVANTMMGMGMVGTIVVLKTSYIVWFGWGKTTSTAASDNPETGRVGVNHSRILGTVQGSQANPMGQLLIAMPPKHYHHESGATASTSKLIGGEFEDNDLLARQMATRLSAKAKKPVQVSCHLDPSVVQNMGLDPDLLHARAAALAEQRIWELLQEQQK